MSVLIETSLGDLVVDLETQQCPRTCYNFLKLCKVKYYNLNAFFNVSKDFIAQTGDPTATGSGGESFQSLHSKSTTTTSTSSSSNPTSRYFPPEINQRLKHTTRGTVSMAVAPSDPPGCGSQFFITLKDDIDYLDGKHAVFGRVVEGEDVLDKLNEVFVDVNGRPLKDIRIRHIEILEDPFPDPSDLIEPQSPIRPPDDPSIVPRIHEDESLDDLRSETEIEASKRAQAASASALTLEMIGDLPFANIRPPENILFVCKLNPVTQDEDLELIFSRFGKILSCEVIRDKKTGDSLQYAFIEFDERESAEMAYFKMQNVLVDDRRIWVDFSQSVSKINGVFSVDRTKSSAMRGGRGGSRGGRGGSGGGGGHTSNKGHGLETPSRYREGGGGGGGGGGGADTVGKGGYGMVFDQGEMSRSRRDDGIRHRERERSPDDRRRDDRKRDDRERERRDRERYDERRESSGRSHDRDKGRDRSPRRDERRRDYR